MKKYVYYIIFLLNSLTGTLSEMTLSASQSHAFQYVNKILSNMEPFSNEETDVDIDESEENNVRFSFF